MFSKELSILDANTVQYMIEVQQEEIERLKEKNREAEEDAKRMKEEVTRLRKLLEEQRNTSA